MKKHSQNTDYQALVSVYENAKDVFEVAKNKKKEAKAFFKSLKKAKEVNTATVYSAYIEYQHEKLKQKFEKLSMCVAKLNIKGFVQSIVEKQHEETEIPTIEIVFNKKSIVEKHTPKRKKTRQLRKDKNKGLEIEPEKPIE
jgi:hypothetical protein